MRFLSRMCSNMYIERAELDEGLAAIREGTGMLASTGVDVMMAKKIGLALKSLHSRVSAE